MTRRCLIALAFVLAGGEALAQPAQVTLDLGGVPLELVLVPGGSFREGSPPTEADRRDDEGPREVTLNRAYYLGVVPVTRGQFARFVAETSYRTESETGRSGGFGLEGGALVQRPSFTWRTPGFAQDDTHPAALLTFTDATRFLAWASQRTGRPLRLPTEAEWEHACRGGTTTAWYTGDTVDLGRTAGWFNEGGPQGTRPVRGRLPNAYGLFDMVGNVQQWVDDWYAPLGTASVTDPHVVTPDPSLTPSRRVLRGGSWLRAVHRGRCAARERATPGSRNADTGLRVAMDASAGERPPSPAPATTGAPTPTTTGAPTPATTDPNVPSEGSIWLCLTSTAAVLMAVILAFLAALVVAVRHLRKQTKAVADVGVSPRDEVVTRLDVRLVVAPDGFRLFAPAYRARQLVHVAYRVNNQRRTAWVAIEPSPSGQFVYTGGRPEALALLAIDDTTEAGGQLGRAGHFVGHDDGGYGGHGAHGAYGGHDSGGSHDSDNDHDDHGSSASSYVYHGLPSAY